MSDKIKYTSSAFNTAEDITADTDGFLVEQPNSTGTRNQKWLLFSALKSWLLNDNNPEFTSVTTDLISTGSLDVTDVITSDSNDGVIVKTQIKFNNGFKLFDDFKTSSSLESTIEQTTSGWYTIAESSSLSYEPVMADFHIAFTGGNRVGSLAFRLAMCDGIVEKARNNNTVEIIKRSLSGNFAGVENVRIAKSDDTAGAGFKVQVYLNINSTVTISKILLQNGMARTSCFNLVTPYLDPTPTLPDGVTTGTFLVAGSKYDFGTLDTRIYTEVGIFAQDDDTLRIAVPWGEIPFQNPSILTINYPTSTLRFYDVGGTNVSVDASDPFDAITSIEADNKFVYFRATKSGHFSGVIQNSPLFLGVEGSDGSFELS